MISTDKNYLAVYNIDISILYIAIAETCSGNFSTLCWLPACYVGKEEQVFKEPLNLAKVALNYLGLLG